MIDQRMVNFINSISYVKEGDQPARLVANMKLAEEWKAEAEKWRAIAERLYNATQEIDYSIMMRAVRAYEEACDE